MFVSPAEPHLFYELGVVNSIPEEYGADFFWESTMGSVGVQRKEFPSDFMSSKNDGRLNKEYRQLQSCDVRVLVLEGKGRWSNDGHLMMDYTRQRWTRAQHRNYLMSVQVHKGISMMSTENIRDTYEWLQTFKAWTMKDEHLSLEVRPAAQREGFWDDISNYDFQVHWLTALPIIGPKIAKNMIEYFDGVPFSLNATVEELMEIPGIGPVRAQRIYDVFHKPDSREVRG